MPNPLAHLKALFARRPRIIEFLPSHPALEMLLLLLPSSLPPTPVLPHPHLLVRQRLLGVELSPVRVILVLGMRPHPISEKLV